MTPSLPFVVVRVTYVNRCLHEMGVSYEVRVVPPLPHRQLRAPGILGSEVPVKKSKGKSSVEFAETSAQVLPSKAAIIPIAKQSSSQVEARKRKTIEDNHPQVILDKDLGTSLFMKELRKTEGGGLWVPEGRRWSMRYDSNQFGSMHAGSGGVRLSVAEAMVQLHQQEPKCRRIASVVDDDESSEEEREDISKDKVLSSMVEGTDDVDVVTQKGASTIGGDAGATARTAVPSPTRGGSMSEASNVGNIDPSGMCD
jgi:hypothetical protein